MAVVRHIANC